MSEPTRPPALSNLDAWRQWAVDDAARRGPPGLPNLIAALAAATVRLRAADWNDDAERRIGGPVETDGRR
jgi:hypothetical protein